MAWPALPEVTEGLSMFADRAVGRLLAAMTLAAALGQGAPASAKVLDVSDRGFAVREEAEVPVTPDEAWAMLLKPSAWWNPEHTWSGSAANLSIDPRAGGCFCEVLPDPASAKAGPRGGVEHMRVVFVERPRALRMTGLLGPLQSGAGAGTMTVQLKPGDDEKHTLIVLEYVVGGYLRTPNEKLAPAVDGMLGEQVRRLGEKLGGSFASAFPAPEAEPTVAPQPSPAAPSGVLPLADQPPAADGGQPAGR